MTWMAHLVVAARLTWLSDEVPAAVAGAIAAFPFSEYFNELVDTAIEQRNLNKRAEERDIVTSKVLLCLRGERGAIFK